MYSQATKYPWRQECKKKLGLIALSIDLASEGDCTRVIPADQARRYVLWVAYKNIIAPDNLRKMAVRVNKAVNLIELAGAYRRSNPVANGGCCVDIYVGGTETTRTAVITKKACATYSFLLGNDSFVFCGHDGLLR